MSTLQIRKLQSGAFKHVDSIDGDFFLGRFNFKQEFNKAFLVEAYGAKRRQYSITEIEVFDFGGTAETFTNWTDLINRLVDLGYTGIDTNSIPSGGGVWGSIIGSISSQTDLQNELNTKLDKVTTNDVEKVYIKNADGTQGMKPVSEFGGGDVTLIHKFTGNGTSITNSPNFISNKSYSVLIPANTFMVGDFVTIEAAFTKLSGGGVEFFQEFYINNIDSLSGAARIAYSAFTPANRVFSKTKRTLAIKSSTETEILHNSTPTATDYFSAATGGNRNIDWTTDKYIIFALLQNGATDSVARLTSCLITKI